MKKLLLLFLAALIVSGCRTVPVSDRTQLMLTTQSYENSAGAEAFAQYKAEYPESRNQVYKTALARCGRAIAAVSEQDDFQWEFIVLETNIQNAFCLPGGKVAVYSGLLDVMKNEAELAAVVSHEAAHAIARHGGERLSWSYLQHLGALGVALGFNDETLTEIYGIGTELGVMLPFSRSNEYEADLIGLILMAKAGYDPQQAVNFWQRFSAGKTVNWVEKVTSTHPCDADRIENLEKHLEPALELYRQCPDKKGKGTIFR